ncbi:MAG: hypothetical protein JSS09_01250 [Verrucomicrobia bacterium]|nr:hypothetical protein [Verrucomicrobiota bacterium]
MTKKRNSNLTLIYTKLSLTEIFLLKDCQLLMTIPKECKQPDNKPNKQYTVHYYKRISIPNWMKSCKYLKQELKDTNYYAIEEYNIGEYKYYLNRGQIHEINEKKYIEGHDYFKEKCENKNIPIVLLVDKLIQKEFEEVKNEWKDELKEMRDTLDTDILEKLYQDSVYESKLSPFDREIDCNNETKYNKRIVDESNGQYKLFDRTQGQTDGIEICDIYTDN